MRKIRPKSILQLTLMGFVVVFFPIVLSLYQAFHTLDELAEKNRLNIQTAVQVTRNSQKVTEIIRDMERSLRQYQLLKSEKLLEIFFKHLDEIDQILLRLEIQLPKKIRQANFEPFKSKILALRSQVDNYDKDPSKLESAIKLLRDLEPLTTKISGSSHAYADRIVQETHVIAQKFQDDLFFKCFTVIPATLILMVLFSLLIARPFRQLHKAITKLGDGEFNHHFSVDGPKDLRDLGTRLNWLATRLSEIDDQKKVFLRHMSHELKTPLAAMKEGGELLADEIPGQLNSRQHEVVDIINKSITYFQKVIENLLDYNLLRSHENLILDMIDLKALVEEMIGTHSLTIRRKNLEVKVLGPQLKMKADRRRLATAIENLVSNAVSFSPKDGAISIHWSADNERLTLEVSDNGPGVKASELDAIFAPFYQGSARKDGPIKGSGIGLSLAKECIKAHKGMIKAIDKQKGACFQIEMPLLATTSRGAE